MLAVECSSGLDADVASERLRNTGYNRLQEKPPRSLWFLFFSQFRSLLILILIFAAALAAIIGNERDAMAILVVVLLNAGIGFIQEYRAEQSLAALRKMLPLLARVRRNGNNAELPAEQLVPGDIVLLEPGDRVPADGRIIQAIGLEINESALTGEVAPVTKSAEILGNAGTPLAEQSNMAFLNSLVTRGRGELLVTATGMQTEMGKLAAELATMEEKPTPLQLQLDRLGKRLALLAGILVGLLFLLNLLRGVPLARVVLDSIALAVAAIPEGLPIVVTVTLALGMQQMARQKAVVKRLASVETLGCTTVICADKTGTLTMNQMAVRAFWYGSRRFTVTGDGYRGEGRVLPVATDDKVPALEPLLIPLVACNDSRIDDGALLGDPTEGALLAFALQRGVHKSAVDFALPRLAEIPFEASRKYMATFHRDKESICLFVKGAPELLLQHCTSYLGRSGREPLNNAARQMILQEYRSLAAQGLRGLLVASRTLPAGTDLAATDLSPLVWELNCCGLVGLLDPPRPEAQEAIRLCQKAGIKVKMITGDHSDTAASIASRLGIKGQVMTGSELEKIDSKELAQRIDSIGVFARVVPLQKLRIVKSLQENGEVVAMTGDGVNDAPALQRADIGVAMGVAGTAVATEAADMVLTDDNFATIVGAVREGRTLYGNIVNFLRFQLATSLGAVMTVFFAPFCGLPDPFTPLQLLWINLIMDGPPAVTLALERDRPGSMSEPPRRLSDHILNRQRSIWVISASSVMAAGTLAVLAIASHSGTPDHAMTLAFTTFVLFQFFNIFNARDEAESNFNRRLFRNRLLWLALGGVLLLQIIAVHWPPAQALFRTTSLDPADWLVACGTAAIILLLDEGRKWLGRTQRHKPGGLKQ